MTGVLYGIGVGPGDPELMTLKAVRLLEECDLIGIPAKEKASCTAWQIAHRAVPGIEKKPVLAVPVPMTRDPEKLCAAYDAGAGKLEEALKEGKNVAFLNLGDPTVYGSYMELYKRLTKAGYKAVVINGVPSFCAVAAALGQPLGDGNEMIHILPGSYELGDLGSFPGTKVLMKSGSRIGEVKEKIALMVRKKEVTAGAVENCGMENQKVYEDIGQLEEEAGYFTTILMKDNR